MNQWVLRCAITGQWVDSRALRPTGAEFPVLLEDGREAYWAEEPYFGPVKPQ